MSAPLLGLVTIGQAPRVDLTPDVTAVLAGLAVVEHGALDDLAPEALGTVAPDPGEAPLASRLRDGSGVVIGHRALAPLLAGAVARCAADGAAAVLVLCTGHLGAIASDIPVLYAEPLAQAGVRGIIGADRLSIVNPMADQVAEATGRWSSVLGRPVLGEHANPYTEPTEAVARAAAALAAQGAQWVFLDCVGYCEAMREAAAEASGLPVLLARTLAARLAAEAALAVGPAAMPGRSASSNAAPGPSRCC
ncbi:MAG TPA: AroM family protein [Cellulomonas sp.]